MKQQLDSETRAAMVAYRLERAHSTLGEADLLYSGGYFNAAVKQNDKLKIKNRESLNLFAVILLYLCGLKATAFFYILKIKSV